MAAGKSTVTNYIKEKHGAVTFRFSDMLRDVLTRLHLETSRANMQTISTLLRQQFGDDLMSKVIAADVAEADAPLIITEGIRRPSDITYLKQVPGFVLVALTADPKVRFERITKRTENPDDATKTWEQFEQEQKQEAEQKIKELMQDADFTIDNDGTKKELFEHTDAILKKLGM